VYDEPLPPGIKPLPPGIKPLPPGINPFAVNKILLLLLLFYLLRYAKLHASVI
jgi:hypothetical protein